MAIEPNEKENSPAQATGAVATFRMNAEELRLDKKWAFGQIRLEIHDGLLEWKPFDEGWSRHRTVRFGHTDRWWMGFYLYPFQTSFGTVHADVTGCTAPMGQVATG